MACPVGDLSVSYVQVGVVSWGVKCAYGYPGMYANVMEVNKWIKNNSVVNGVESIIHIFLTSDRNIELTVT